MHGMFPVQCTAIYGWLAGHHPVLLHGQLSGPPALALGMNEKPAFRIVSTIYTKEKKKEISITEVSSMRYF